MKKNYFLTLIFTLFISGLSFGQTTLAAQDFEGATSDDWSYTEAPATYNVSSDTWAVVSSVGSISSAQNQSSFWGMRDLENGNGGTADEHTLTFPNKSVSGETNTLLSFYYYTDGFDTTDYIQVEYFFDDVSQGKEDLNKNTDAWTYLSKVVPDGTTNVSFVIIAKQNGGSDYAGIDNVLLQSGASVSPSLAINSPTENSTVNSGFTGFDVSLDIQNFTLSGDDGSGGSDSSGDGYIKYDIGGASMNSFSSTINLTDLSSGSVTLSVELVDNSGSSLSPALSDSVVFTVNNIVQTLPLYESFDYTASETLASQANWTNNFSGDDVLIESGSLSYTGLPSSVGNSISFDGSGADPSIDFASTSSGKIYASFILKVTDLSSMDSSDYFGILRDDTGNYVSRLFIGYIDDATFKIGISNSSTLTQETSSIYNQDDVLFVVMSYDLDADTVSAWVNPTLGGTEPTATLTEAASSTATNMVQFLFRQDNAGDTPGMTIDELRISTSWSDVAPSSGNSVTVATSQAWNAYVNAFNVSDGAYAFGFAYTVSDLRATPTATSMTLEPNTAIWTAEATNAGWFDQGATTQTANKYIEALSYIEDASLANEELTFSGNVSVSDLGDGYTVVAFIKTLTSSYSTVAYKTADISSTGDFTITATADEMSQAVIQYGFAVTGPLADPADTTLGSVVIGAETLSVEDTKFINVISVYPNPSNSNWNFRTPNTVINSVEVFNLLGKRVASQRNNNSTEASISTQGLTNGIYIARITTEQGAKSVKLIKN